MKDYLKAKVKQVIPQSILNNVLLTFPFLYRTQLVNYETSLEGSVCELLSQLGAAITLDGDIIECGSPYCGTSIIIADYLRSIHVNKTVYAYDSFEGFDQTELNKERKEGLVKTQNNAFTFTSYEYVKRKIKKLGFAGAVVPVKGFFEQTLPKWTGELCFAFIDCDLRDSTIYCAEKIWPNLVSGGRLVIDDYSNGDFRGAKLGVDFFVNKYRDNISAHGNDAS
jgi:O-methyltransferase